MFWAQSTRERERERGYLVRETKTLWTDKLHEVHFVSILAVRVIIHNVCTSCLLFCLNCLHRHAGSRPHSGSHCSVKSHWLPSNQSAPSANQRFVYWETTQWQNSSSKLLQSYSTWWNSGPGTHSDVKVQSNNNSNNVNENEDYDDKNKQGKQFFASYFERRVYFTSVTWKKDTRSSYTQ